MNAAEAIAAAIEKLERLRGVASPGTWWLEGGEPFGYAIACEKNLIVPRMEIFSEDAELVVTLHRTIDAQLAILRHTLAHYSGDLGIGTNRLVVDLARAVLGEVPDAS